MKRYRWQIILGLLLILASVVLYLIDYEVFGGARDIFIFLMGSIAFVPVEVLLVTLIINGLLSQREADPARKDEYGHRELLQRSGDIAVDLLFRLRP